MLFAGQACPKKKLPFICFPSLPQQLACQFTKHLNRDVLILTTFQQTLITIQLFVIECHRHFSAGQRDSPISDLVSNSLSEPLLISVLYQAVVVCRVDTCVFSDIVTHPLIEKLTWLWDLVTDSQRVTWTAFVILAMYMTRCQIWCTIEFHRDPISKVLSEW